MSPIQFSASGRVVVPEYCLKKCSWKSKDDIEGIPDGSKPLYEIDLCKGLK